MLQKSKRDVRPSSKSGMPSNKVGVKTKVNMIGDSIPANKKATFVQETVKDGFYSFQEIESMLGIEKPIDLTDSSKRNRSKDRDIL